MKFAIGVVTWLERCDRDRYLTCSVLVAQAAVTVISANAKLIGIVTGE